MLLPITERKGGGGDVLSKSQCIIYIVYIQVKRGPYAKMTLVAHGAEDVFVFVRGLTALQRRRQLSTHQYPRYCALRACTAALYNPVSGSRPERS